MCIKNEPIDSFTIGVYRDDPSLRNAAGLSAFPGGAMARPICSGVVCHYFAGLFDTNIFTRFGQEKAAGDRVLFVRRRILGQAWSGFLRQRGGLVHFFISCTLVCDNAFVFVCWRVAVS